MNILNSLVKTFGVAIFSVAVAFLILSTGLIEFTEYENLKSIYIEIFSSQMGNVGRQMGADYDENDLNNMTEKELRESYQSLLEMCEGEEYIEVPTETEEPIRINCNKIREGSEKIETGDVREVLGEIMASALFDNIYYKEYDCSFVECLQTGESGVLFSSKANSFFKNVRLFSIAGIIAGAAGILISSKTWDSRLKGLGWPLVITGLSYILMEFGNDFVESQLPSLEETGINVMEIINPILQSMMDGFLIALVTGIVLTAGGYIIQFKKSKEGEDSDK